MAVASAPPSVGGSWVVGSEQAARSRANAVSRITAINVGHARADRQGRTAQACATTRSTLTAVTPGGLCRGASGRVIVPRANYIAGSVMFALFLVAAAAGIGGVDLVIGGEGRTVMLVPAIALWLLAFVAISTIGVIAAILATRTAPAK